MSFSKFAWLGLATLLASSAAAQEMGFTYQFIGMGGVTSSTGITFTLDSSLTAPPSTDTTTTTPTDTTTTTTTTTTTPPPTQLPPQNLPPPQNPPPPQTQTFQIESYDSPTVSVPDSGASALLLAGSLISLTFLRRHQRRS